MQTSLGGRNPNSSNLSVSDLSESLLTYFLSFLPEIARKNDSPNQVAEAQTSSLSLEKILSLKDHQFYFITPIQIKYFLSNKVSFSNDEVHTLQKLLESLTVLPDGRCFNEVLKKKAYLQYVMLTETKKVIQEFLDLYGENSTKEISRPAFYSPTELILLIHDSIDSNNTFEPDKPTAQTDSDAIDRTKKFKLLSKLLGKKTKQSEQLPATSTPPFIEQDSSQDIRPNKLPHGCLSLLEDTCAYTSFDSSSLRAVLNIYQLFDPFKENSHFATTTHLNSLVSSLSVIAIRRPIFDTESDKNHYLEVFDQLCQLTSDWIRKFSIRSSEGIANELNKQLNISFRALHSSLIDFNEKRESVISLSQLISSQISTESK
jgi:hypothetical protein